MRRNTSTAAAARRYEVARLFFRGGMSTEKLAAKFGVTGRQIRYDLDEVRREWREKMGEKLEELKADLLTELEMTKSEAKRGWRRSLRNAEKKSAKIVTGGEDGGERKETQKVEEGRSGHQPFLETIRGCIGDVRKMLGLDAQDGKPPPAEVVIRLGPGMAITELHGGIVADGSLNGR